MADYDVIVAAPYVLLRTDAGSIVGLHRGDVIPENADSADVDRLLGEGFLAESPAVEPAAADRDEGKPATADEILADVGDDPEKAAAVLEVEKASDKPRSTLIAKLEKVIEKAAAES